MTTNWKEHVNIDIDLVEKPAYGSAWFRDVAGVWSGGNEYAIDRQNGVGFRIARSER
tara:strand:- start:48 stop:218 length:171 start_codon:yes stop_codon:yes gene_type:complete